MKKKNKVSALISFLLIYIIVFCFTTSAATQALHQIGQKPHEFSLKDIKGNKVSFSDFSGKKAVIILFWSTWSRKSEAALKRFGEYFNKYKDRGIQVVGINAENQHISDQDIAKIKGLIDRLKITFPVLIDNGLDTFHSYGIIALPSTMVITEDRIDYALPGFPIVGTEDMFDYLLVLAGEPPRKKSEPKYTPKYDAIAAANLARKFAGKKRMGVLAVQQFKKAIKKDPKYILPYIELSKMYETQTKFDKAEETLRQALTVEPDNITIKSELGFLLTKAGKVKEAVEILDKTVEQDSYTPAHYYFAYAIGTDGRLDESLKAFDRAIELNPFDSMIYILRGEIYEKNSMLKEASSDYKKAVELLAGIED